MRRPRGVGIWLLAALLVAGSACKPEDAHTWALGLGQSGVVLEVEIAATPEARATGLSGREAPPEGGMLFIFPQPQEASFWMRDVPFDLDIAFMDETGRIFQIERMKAQVLTAHTSSSPARYALEVAAGAFAEAGVKVGDPVNLPREIKELQAR